MGMIEISEVELEHFLIYSVRYALGRQTYAVSDVCEALSNHKKEIRHNYRQAIIKDIENYTNDNSDYYNQYWLEVLEELKEVEYGKTN